MGVPIQLDEIKPTPTGRREGSQGTVLYFFLSLSGRFLSCISDSCETINISVQDAREASLQNTTK